MMNEDSEANCEREYDSDQCFQNESDDDEDDDYFEGTAEGTEAVDEDDACLLYTSRCV